MTTRTRPDHGDHRLYRHGCRCQECRDADRNNRKKGELRRHRGVSGHVPGPLVAAHINALTNSGWTRAQIAATSGVSDRAIGYILTGQTRVQRGNAVKLLRLQPLLEAPRIDVTGTRRRIQALAAIGWPVTRTAALAGVSDRYAFDVLGGHIATIERAIADRYAAVYRTHFDKPGPSRFARSIARRNGWHGPLAWDGNIDDPHAVPDVDGAAEPELKRDELAELRRAEIEHLAAFGIGEHEIARRLGMAVKSVHQILDELRTGTRRNRNQKQEAAA